ncbi:MAG: recombination-associated protein RdgC, partial [Simplicispira suum]
MFKNLIVYRIAPSSQLELQRLQAALTAAPFAPCGATQEQSGGW